MAVTGFPRPNLTPNTQERIRVDQFTERLARLAELSDEELASLEEELVVAFDAADEAADLDGMQSLADAIDSIRAEKEVRNPAEEAPVEEATAEPVVEELPVEMAASANDEETVTEEPALDETPESAVTADADNTEETTLSDTPNEEVPAETGTETEEVAAPEAPEVDAPTEAETAQVEEKVKADDDNPAADNTVDEESVESDDQSTADAPEAEATNAADVAEESEEQVAEEITAEDVPEANLPVAAAARPYTIRAGGDIPGITAGTELNGMDDIVEAMTKKVNSMRGVGGDGEHIVVASFQFDEGASDERTLKPGDLNGNAKKIRDFLAEPEALTHDALVAGAWCAPRTPIYDVPTVGTTSRPVRDSLPSFNAERGGITWIAPPGLPVEATSLWRYDNDDSTWKSYSDVEGTTETNPTQTKPCITIPCGPEQNADVDAIPVCFCFDNLSARAFPEWVRANTELVLIGQARFAEQVLLSKMYAVAATGNSCGTPATQVGAARDFILTVQTAAAAKRWTLRLGENAPLQLLAPEWVRTAIAVDLGLQAPGDGTFTTSTSAVDGYFREFNVDPIWHIDDVPGSTAFTGCAFPGTADWLLFPAGSFLRLDTGELNLGVVRTKEDVQKNKYCEFAETFETVAYTGPDSPNGWITIGETSIDIIGGSGGPITALLS
jgi:hypothetical protein